MRTKLTFVHALSPLHAGTGQGIGVIDLPIAREKATGIPFLPGSSLKGSLRDLCEHSRKLDIFGPETADAAEYAGSAQFSDQRLLLLPIRSLKGTFAWVTSPYVLQRFVRDAEGASVKQNCFQQVPSLKETECGVAETNSITQDKKVILEDLDLDVNATWHSAVGKWAEFLGEQVFPGNRPEDQAWRSYLSQRLCVVSDDVFNFLLNTATEITARIKLLEDKKTVQKGGLWYEEALPAETILSGLLVATEIKQKNGDPRIKADDIFQIVEGTVKKADKSRPVQFGGKATVGRGLCYVHFSSAKEAAK
ncbi:MAG: type III-B CRISPR module RAMP protein Cmr4 [Acidobacteria bacterium]|nr:type III-B CRISPR module RAMP protein Cmr4 [Acidobacteriota bacterium]